MTPRNILILCVGLLTGAEAVRAQDPQVDTVDTQLRAGVELALDLPHGWELGVAYQLRMIDDLSTYRGSYFTIEGSYGLTKEAALLGNFRRAITNVGDSNRYGLGFEYERKLARWKIGLRGMVQHRAWVPEDDSTLPSDDDDVGGNAATFARARLRLKYAASKRLDLYGSVEPAFVFGEDYPIDNWRNTLGIRYEYSKNRSLDLYYTMRPDYGKDYNRLFHVVGLSLRFKTKVRGR